ncbi:MAG TPA: DUF2189 domain-containing protein [Pseudothauera hydrothermalis]|nr:DUF2189 domain-containing protein [Pseudothauera hydrothermalis]
MDHSYHPLDHHFQLPHVRRVATAAPLHWLRLGWEDLRANPLASLTHGAILSIIGYLILAYAANKPYLFTAAISGFLLIGPLAAAGLYEISRRRELGERIGWAESIRALGRHRANLFYCGIMLAFMLIAWERISAILFALLYSGNLPEVSNLLRDVFLNSEQLRFTLAWLGVGAALAALVFALMVVAIPMLMARDTDIATAMMSSLRAVSVNPGAMALLAALIVIAMAVGFATLMVGMVVLLPLLGHATWHAYRELIE